MSESMVRGCPVCLGFCSRSGDLGTRFDSGVLPPGPGLETPERTRRDVVPSVGCWRHVVSVPERPDEALLDRFRELPGLPLGEAPGTAWPLAVSQVSIGGRCRMLREVASIVTMPGRRHATPGASRR